MIIINERNLKMDVFECIKGRRSIRDFKDDKIEHSVFEKIIDTARFSPSWKNTQIARYIIVEDKNIMNDIADKCVCDFKFNSSTIKKAAALVLVTIISGRSGFERDGSFATSKGDGWEMFDAGIATQTLCLAAHENGLGSVILGIFDEEKISKLVNIPDGQQLAALVAMGYPNETPVAPKRKEVGELISYI